MFGPFRITNPLSGGLLWKIPWRLSKFQKRRHRLRLRAVDNVVATLDAALAKKGQTLEALERWKAEMPTEPEMLPKDKYTMFDRKVKKYRKGIHSRLFAWGLVMAVLTRSRIAQVDESFTACQPSRLLKRTNRAYGTRIGGGSILPEELQADPSRFHVQHLVFKYRFAACHDRLDENMVALWMLGKEGSVGIDQGAQHKDGGMKLDQTVAYQCYILKGYQFPKKKIPSRIVFIVHTFPLHRSPSSDHSEVLCPNHLDPRRSLHDIRL